MPGRAKTFRSRKAQQQGFSLIETAIAMLVLTIGALGGAVMVMAAITTDGRNKLDTGATVLSQQVMEVVLGQGALGVGNVQVTDCLGNNFNVAVAGTAAPGSGAALVAASGAIDFTAAKVANYSMVYNSCRANGDPIPYDVRWNVVNLRTGPGGVETKQVTVAARPTGAANGNDGSARMFAVPVTLTGVTGR